MPTITVLTLFLCLIIITAVVQANFEQEEGLHHVHELENESDQFPNLLLLKRHRLQKRDLHLPFSKHDDAKDEGTASALKNLRKLPTKPKLEQPKMKMQNLFNRMGPQVDVVRADKVKGEQEIEGEENEENEEELGIDDAEDTEAEIDESKDEDEEELVEGEKEEEEQGEKEGEEKPEDPENEEEGEKSAEETTNTKQASTTAPEEEEKEEIDKKEPPIEEGVTTKHITESKSSKESEQSETSPKSESKPVKKMPKVPSPEKKGSAPSVDVDYPNDQESDMLHSPDYDEKNARAKEREKGDGGGADSITIGIGSLILPYLVVLVLEI